MSDRIHAISADRRAKRGPASSALGRASMHGMARGPYRHYPAQQEARKISRLFDHKYQPRWCVNCRADSGRRMGQPGGALGCCPSRKSPSRRNFTMSTRPLRSPVPTCGPPLVVKNGSNPCSSRHAAKSRAGRARPHSIQVSMDLCHLKRDWPRPPQASAGVQDKVQQPVSAPSPHPK